MASRTPPPSSKRHHNEKMMFRQRHSRGDQHQPTSKSRDSSPNNNSVSPSVVIKGRGQGPGQVQGHQRQQQVQQTAQVPAASPASTSNEGKQASFWPISDPLSTFHKLS